MVPKRRHPPDFFGGHRLDILTFDEALAVVRELAVTPRTEDISVFATDIPHRRLAEGVAAAIDMPPFSRSMMDGYALHESDLQSTHPLVVIDDVKTGDAPRQVVTPGTAIQVRTGAPIPDGTAGVARNEWIDIVSPTEDDGRPHIRLLRSVHRDESIQRRGEDAARGDAIAAQGEWVDGQTVSVLRAAGVDSVRVFARCTVAIICTGSELLTAPTPRPLLGQVFAANDAFLRDGLQQVGATVVDVQFVPDDVDAMVRAITRYVDSVDYVIVTGGASVGDTDYAKQALMRVSHQDVLPVTRVWMRPGSPFAAVRSGRTTLFNLSGNPAAAFVQFHTLVLAAIRKTLGEKETTVFPIRAQLAVPLTLKPVKHVRLHRACVQFQSTGVTVIPEPKQSSGSLTGLLRVNAIVRLDESKYQSGDEVSLLCTRPLYG